MRGIGFQTDFSGSANSVLLKLFNSSNKSTLRISIVSERVRVIEMFLKEVSAGVALTGRISFAKESTIKKKNSHFVVLLYSIQN